MRVNAEEKLGPHLMDGIAPPSRKDELEELVRAFMDFGEREVTGGADML